MSLQEIYERVCRISGVDIRSRSQRRDIGAARNLFCYYGHREGYTYRYIGEFLDRRDFSTICYSCTTASRIKDVDPITGK